MKRSLILFTLLVSSQIVFSQTFDGIKTGLYKGEVDEFARGEVSVWIDIDENNKTLGFKTKQDQPNSQFKIVHSTKDYYLGRAGSSKIMYIPKDNQAYMWSDRTITGYGQGYGQMKDRCKKIYSLEKLGIEFKDIGVLVFEAK